MGSSILSVSEVHEDEVNKRKSKVSVKRRIQLNAAAKRYKKRQKEELEGLRARVAGLEAEVTELRKKAGNTTDAGIKIQKQIPSVVMGESHFSCVNQVQDSSSIMGDVKVEVALTDQRVTLLDPISSVLSINSSNFQNIPESSTGSCPKPSPYSILHRVTELKKREMLNASKRLVSLAKLSMRALVLPPTADYVSEVMGFQVCEQHSDTVYSFNMTGHLPDITPYEVIDATFCMHRRSEFIDDNINSVFHEVLDLSEDIIFVNMAMKYSWMTMAYGNPVNCSTFLIARWCNEATGEYFLALESMNDEDMFETKEEMASRMSVFGIIRASIDNIGGIPHTKIEKYMTKKFLDDRPLNPPNCEPGSFLSHREVALPLGVSDYLERLKHHVMLKKLPSLLEQLPQT